MKTEVTAAVVATATERRPLSLAQLSKAARNRLFPLPLHGLLLSPLVGCAASSLDFFPVRLFANPAGHVVTSTLLSPLLYALLSQLIRLSLTLTLYYHGWMFEEFGKPPSLATKLFMVVMKVLYGRADFLSYRNLLPWLPLPSVHATVSKYLRTVRPLLTDDEYERVVSDAAEFERSVAPRLQRRLWLKWLTSPNYVSDWWKELVYLRGRGSLIKSNVGCADVCYQKTTSKQAARAAALILIMQNFRRQAHVKQSFKPITMGSIPICPSQYVDFHRSLRVPGLQSDRMIHLPRARHIAVWAHGCWYKLDIFQGRRLVKAAELQRALQQIIDRADVDKPDEGERLLGALTAGPRDLWARIRDQKFASGPNKTSLAMIERALEVLFLVDEEYGYDEHNPESYRREYAQSLHGDGYRLWCDKPATYTVSRNGRFTSNMEHSVADAMVGVHIREYIKYEEAFRFPYDKCGDCADTAAASDEQPLLLPTFERLRWQFDEETLDAINQAYGVAKSVADDFDNAEIVFKEFGKNALKKVGLSPDAFIQCALQLAYFRETGKFELTYEPAVMRLFREGRTETVRSCSIESCQFVRSMSNDGLTDSERVRLLRAACEQHQNYVREAMCGRAVDRHLFGLYVVARYMELSSAFLNGAMSMNYALSTSQTPQHQVLETMAEMNKRADLFWPSGGFCCPDGSRYGVCYAISAAGNELSFHVSAWKSNVETDAARFRDRIVEALRDMRSVCDRATQSPSPTD